MFRRYLLGARADRLLGARFPRRPSLGPSRVRPRANNPLKPQHTNATTGTPRSPNPPISSSQPTVMLPTPTHPTPHPQQSATANMRSLDGLLTLMSKRKGGKGVVAKAMEALQELFATVLLPDRRLKVLEQQPLQVRGAGARRLVLCILGRRRTCCCSGGFGKAFGGERGQLNRHIYILLTKCAPPQKKILPPGPPPRQGRREAAAAVGRRGRRQVALLPVCGAAGDDVDRHARVPEGGGGRLIIGDDWW
jgi:hypothetical protein